MYLLRLYFYLLNWIDLVWRLHIRYFLLSIYFLNIILNLVLLRNLLLNIIIIFLVEIWLFWIIKKLILRDYNLSQLWHIKMSKTYWTNTVTSYCNGLHNTSMTHDVTTGTLYWSNRFSTTIWTYDLLLHLKWLD